MSYEDCIKKGKLKKVDGAKDRIKKSFEIAKNFLESAKNNLTIREYSICVITAYNSAFHVCRALLFKKGYVEKSHYCMIQALKRFYLEDEVLRDFLNQFDKIRMSRHEIQYRGEFSDEKEARFVIDFARDFLDYALKISNKK